LVLAVVFSFASPGLAAEDDVPGAAPEVLNSVPPPRQRNLPRARWEYRANGPLWTRVALSAVKTHGRTLIETVPDDIADWCPAYPGQGEDARAAFWAALLSTLSRYESTWDPRAVGGGGLWFGLLQIYPPTAEFRKCRVQTGDGLMRASANLNCAVRIMAITVPRDNAIAVKDTRWRGVAADWGPIRTNWMRADMQRYTRRQSYCRPLVEKPPRPRPPRG
jgi:hypothetical protein